jgi:CRISPR-associated protein Cas1
MENELVSLSMLNALVYCPRRFYLEQVEGVFAVNAPVQDGRIKHARVDDRSKAMKTHKAGDEFQTRSVQLGSERLGIIGVLDVVEETDGEVCPVEFKRGTKPKDENDRDYYWENDAVQLCAQAMLLEENTGKPIKEGVLYYIGSRDRVGVPLTDELRQKTLGYVEQARALMQSKQIPPPLVDSPKCPKCSLLAICMPQETRFLREREQAQSVAAPAKHVLAPVEEPTVLYFQEQGAYVDKHGEHLELHPKDGEKRRIPLVNISQVVIFGHVQFSTAALEVLLELEIPVVFLSIYGQYKGTLTGPPARNGNLRLNQYRYCSNPDWALAMSREIVAAKILNCRTLLMRSLRCATPDETEIAPDSPPTVQEPLGLDYTTKTDEAIFDQLRRFAEKARTANDLEELLGFEGTAAKMYFENFSRMIRGEGEARQFDFTSRNRRPPRDPVNALLSFAYAMLVKDVTTAILTVGLDPHIGFYHSAKHGRPSLALDLMEEFRSVIADSVVLTLMNKKMLTPRDFVSYGGTCLLNDTGRKTFFQAYEQRRKTEVIHPLFKYRCSYRRVLEVQARHLAGVFRGEFQQYQPFLIR